MNVLGAFRTQKASGGAVFSWCLYDFANSAFATTILAVIYNRYYAGVVAQGETGVDLTFFGNTFNVHGAAMFNYIVALAMFIVAISSPILGALADSLTAKKKFLQVYLLLGAVSTGMLVTVGPGEWLAGGIWFILANIGFAGGNVFYNALIKDIATPDEMGKVSGLGWGIGYLGGGLLLAINLLMLQTSVVLPISIPEISFLTITEIPGGVFTVHHTFLTVAIWWAVFSLPLLIFVQERKETDYSSDRRASLREPFSRLKGTFKDLKRYRQLLRFLIAYLFFNDGIETVIIMAAVFGDQVLHMNQTLLIGYFLLIQFTAFFGSILFGRISSIFGNKNSLMATLFVWCGVVTAAFMIGWSGRPILEYFILGVVAGVVMGASQAIARAMQGTFTPSGKEAEFFGFFAVSGKFAAIFGPLTYGAVVAVTRSLRVAILTLILFFIVGIILLWRVNEREGLHAAQTEMDQDKLATDV